jgi:hypothetical protein
MPVGLVSAGLGVNDHGPVTGAHFITAEDIHHAPREHPEMMAVEACVFRHWRHPATGVPAQFRLKMKGPWPHVLAPSPVAEARVDHGRWIVDCPFAPCGGAEYASRTDKRFWCCECGNAGTGEWVAVAWPSELDVAAIEATLGLRPQLEARNWQSAFRRAVLGYPTGAETVPQLLAENKVAGL